MTNARSTIIRLVGLCGEKSEFLSRPKSRLRSEFPIHRGNAHRGLTTNKSAEACCILHKAAVLVIWSSYTVVAYCAWYFTLCMCRPSAQWQLIKLITNQLCAPQKNTNKPRTTDDTSAPVGNFTQKFASISNSYRTTKTANRLTKIGLAVRINRV